MHIQIATKKREVPFSSLKDGDVFSHGVALFMKAEANATVNAVSIANGCLTHFGADIYVMPRLATLVVE